MEQLKASTRSNQADLLMTGNYGWSDLLNSAESLSSNGMELDSSFGIHRFYIEKGNNHLEAKGFEAKGFEAETRFCYRRRLRPRRVLSRMLKLPSHPRRLLLSVV